MPLLGALGSLFGTAITTGLGAAFQPGGIFGGGGFRPSGAVAPYTATAAALPALPPPPGGAITLPGGMGIVTWPRWVLSAVRVYGPEVASAIFKAYQQRVRSGQSSSSARKAVMQAYPGIKIRRRMNPTNVRALRRAVRRVRSFQRTTRKVSGLFPRGARGAAHYHYRPRRRRRGDVDPFYAEDMADVFDTAEDLGYEPESFPGEEVGE